MEGVLFDQSAVVAAAAPIDRWRFVGDSFFESVPEVEADHRRHAVVEQSIAELKSVGLVHLPSGNCMANAAWLALTVMTHNLGRTVAILAGPDLQRATAATLRRKVSTMPGRLVHSGRRRHLRLPASWPWAEAMGTTLASIYTIPLRC